LAWGCASDAAPGEPEPQHDIATLDADLKLGAEGDEVRALHEYLTRFGYFPNPELQHSFPSWRPIVSQPPAFSDVFDERTENAVLAYQEQMGLTPTGVVDAATRAIMRAPRCGVPDGIPEQDPHEKWALLGYKLTQSPIKWCLQHSTSEDGIIPAVLTATIGKAFVTWANETGLNFGLSCNSPNLELKFQALNNADGTPNGPGRALAVSFVPPAPDGTDDLWFDTAETWTLTGMGGPDLETVALHEIGHLIGLGHSPILSTIMHPAIGNVAVRRTLDPDDTVGASVIYDDWFKLTTGGVRDIAPSSAATWAVTTMPRQGGFKVGRWNGSSWTVPAGPGAVRIAVDSFGRPFIVDQAGSIFRRTSSSADSGDWVAMPNCAKDIGAGFFPEDVWMIGCDSRLYQWNPQASAWVFRVELINGTVLQRVAVDRAGDAYVVDSNGGIHRWKKNAPGLEPLPGCARDIGAYYATWVIGCSTTAGGHHIHVWNEQPAIPGDVPAKFDWVDFPGGGEAIAVGPGGPWVVNDVGAVFYQTPATTGFN
jgi:hypothetical protein